MNSCRVSVLMPCYNHARYVGQAISSVLAQTDPDFELIVIDNGSTDDSWQVIQSFQDPRIKTFRLEKNQGICGAWAFGMEHCHGEWFAFLSADDYITPQKHEIQLAYLAAHPEVDAVCSYLEEVGDDSQRIAEPRWVEQNINQPRDFNTLEAWMMRQYVCMSANMYRRRLCVAPANGSNVCCDYHFHLLLLRSGCRFAQIQQVFLHYRSHALTTTMQERPTAAPQYAYLYATQYLPYLRESGQEEQAGEAILRFFDAYCFLIGTASPHDQGATLLAMLWPDWVAQHCPDYNSLAAVEWETRQDVPQFHALRAMTAKSFWKWTASESTPRKRPKTRGWLRETGRKLERRVRRMIKGGVDP